MHVLPETGKHPQLLTSAQLHMGPSMEIGNLCSQFENCEHMDLQGCCPLFSHHHRSLLMHPRHAILGVGKI